MYKVQYYIQVETEYGDITGVGWYDKGSTARIKILTPTIKVSKDERVVL